MLSQIGRSRERNHLINQRRRIENHRDEFLAIEKENRSVGLKARWEEKTTHKIIKNRVRDRLDELRRERSRQLDARRDALAEKLRRENLQFEQELGAMQETPVQRRRRMEQRARELKEQRMARDDEFNRQMLTKKFRLESDLLREAKSRAMHLHVAADRITQVEEKEVLKQIEQEQNDYFDQLWEQQRLQAMERARQEEAIREEMKHKFRSVLDKQVHQLQDYRQELEAIEAEETKLMQEKWKLEEEEEKQRMLQRREEALRIRRETDRFNTYKRAQIEQEMREERERDLEMLNSILKREQEEDEREQAKRKRMREEAKQYQQWLLQQMERDKEDEASLERLRQIYSDQQWQKRIDTWEKEKRARQKLMEEVMEERKRQIQHRLDEAAKRRQEALEDRDRIMRDIEAMYEEHRREMEENFARQKEHQAEIMRQIAEKKEREQRERQQLLEEYRQQQLQEQRYMELLRHDLEQLELEKPAQYRHIPTLKADARKGIFE